MAETDTAKYIRASDIDNRSTRIQRMIWRLEAILLQCLYWWPIKSLGIERASNVGGMAAKWIGPKLSKHKVVRRNLKLAFPEMSEREREDIAVAAWENVGRTLGEMPHLPKLNPYTGDRVDVIGAHHLAAISDADHGAVLISGHFANFELIGAAISHCAEDCLVTYRSINNPIIDRRLNKLRHDYGTKLLAPKGMGTRELMRALSQKRSVGLMNDQKFNQGLAIPFFGHDAMTAPGPTRLALKYKVPMIFITAQRTGPARFRIEFHEPFWPERTGDLETDIRTNVTHINKLIETEVRANPHQWFWQHRRWPKQAWADAGAMD